MESQCAINLDPVRVHPGTDNLLFIAVRFTLLSPFVCKIDKLKLTCPRLAKLIRKDNSHLRIILLCCEPFRINP